MMTRIKMLCGRAGASAIAVALAFSPTHATVPKPIVDLSKSPAVSGKPAPPAKPATKARPMIGPFDEQTAELGGGAFALLALGAAFAISRRNRHEDAGWDEDAMAPEPRDPLFDEPMFQHAPATNDGSAFRWGDQRRTEDASHDGSERRPGESWVERAYRGPSPANPSSSLRARLRRAAFFDKRERDVAAGTAAPVEADAGLPEAMADERELEAI